MAITDIRIETELVIVKKTTTGEEIINTVINRSRLETEQDVYHSSSMIDIPPSEAPLLPLVGLFVEKNKMYNYNNETILCLQDHERTIYPPEDTPALFSFYRVNTDNLEWESGEIVEVTWVRIYQTIKYEVIQAHQTQDSWTPDVTPSLWEVQSSACLDWVKPTGAHDAYNIGDCALFNGIAYLSLVDGNVYSLIEYPSGWELKP